MTHTWSVKKIRYVESTGKITHLHWNLTSTDGTNTVSKYGSVYLPHEATIPFASVTQQLLMNWLEDRMTDTTEQSEFESGMSTLLERMVSPDTIVADAPA